MVDHASTPAPQTGEGATQFLVELGRSTTYEIIPDDVVRRMKFFILDWLAVSFIGSTIPLSQMTREIANPRPDGDVTVFGGDFEKASIMDAVLANGTTAHALDFDDGAGTSGIPHSAVTIVTTALAFAEQRNLSGRQFLEAIFAAHEVGVRITELMGDEHYEKGFHKMATNGAYCAAVAASYLCDLDEQQWLMALGIAGTQASGLRANFGTMTKPLHAGCAARNGTLACLLAEKGFTASPNILEARFGYAWTQSPVPVWKEAFRPLGRPFVAEGIRFKYHAACSGTHSPIEATRYLARTEKLDPDEVEHITVLTYPLQLDVCNIAFPKTALEAKFSIRFTTALGLLDWDTTEAGFNNEIVNNERIRAISERISVGPLENATTHDDTEVEITMKDGRVFRRHHRFADHRLTIDEEWDAIVEKFFRCAAPVIDHDKAERIKQMVENIDQEVSMRSFVRSIADISCEN